MDKFIKELIGELQRALGSCYGIEPVQTMKNNEVTLSGIRITKAGDKISPVIYVDNDFAGYIIGRLSMEMIVSGILKQLQDNTDMSAIAEEVMHYDLIKDKLSVALINYDANKKLLSRRPHKKFLDLAIVFYIRVTSENGLSGAVHVTYDFLKVWNISKKTLIAQSMKNMIVRDFHHIVDMHDVCNVAELADEDEELREILEDAQENMRGALYMFTNGSHYFGANVLLNTVILHRFAMDHNSNLIIYPCSLHEVMVTFETNRTSGRLDTEDIRHINEESVIREEQLSNSVYIYDRVKKKLQIHKQGAPLCVKNIKDAV